MPDLSLVHRMTAYMAWADDVMLTTAQQMSDADLLGPSDTLFGSIAGTFDHVLVVAEMFRAHLEGRDHSHRARQRDATLSFSEIAERLRSMNDYYVDLARRLPKAELAGVVAFRFVNGGEGRMTREDILLHLVNHATYHRGFVSTLLYPLGVKGRANDLTVFLRDVWPALSEACRESVA